MTLYITFRLRLIVYMVSVFTAQKTPNNEYSYGYVIIFCYIKIMTNVVQDTKELML